MLDHLTYSTLAGWVNSSGSGIFGFDHPGYRATSRYRLGLGPDVRNMVEQRQMHHDKVLQQSGQKPSYRIHCPASLDGCREELLVEGLPIWALPTLESTLASYSSAPWFKIRQLRPFALRRSPSALYPTWSLGRGEERVEADCRRPPASAVACRLGRCWVVSSMQRIAQVLIT